MKTGFLIVMAMVATVMIFSLILLNTTNDKTQEEGIFSYDVEYDSLVTKHASVSAKIAMQPLPDKVCYDISDLEFETFPEKLKEAMTNARDEILTQEQVAEFGNDRFFFEDVYYFEGAGETIHPRDALGFLKEYDSFTIVEEPTNENIRHIDDASFHFDCDVKYKNEQYKISFRFAPLYPSWENFVNIDITKNEFGQPIIQNSDVTVYHTFNATALFSNKLDHSITLSRQDDRTIEKRGFAFDEITIPSGQSWSYMLRTWNLEEDTSHQSRSIPFSYEIQPGNMNGKITVKNYPRCMTENEMTSLYSQVKAHPKFPSYLPDGYSFQCGIHNMNAYVHMTYWTDNLRQKYDEQVGGSFQYEFFANGGMSIDYYNEYVLSGWPDVLDYDKYEKSQEKAEHPRANSMMILGEPAVMTQEAARVHGEIQSYNSLQVFLGNGVHYQIRSSLPQEEIIKIAESIIQQELN